ncbi:GBS Bsp-like repeat-containing protein [Streptococcus sp. H49]|uniref:GBS Bsp-like repeat-containing protein n=1 Tax=Streptococcus huangxiaojuni TaxID=3237239 RepID=UPI0034A5AED2
MKKQFLNSCLQRFSIRKCSFGVASILLGSFLLLSTKTVNADEQCDLDNLSPNIITFIEDITENTSDSKDSIMDSGTQESTMVVEEVLPAVELAGNQEEDKALNSSETQLTESTLEQERYYIIEDADVTGDRFTEQKNNEIVTIPTSDNKEVVSYPEQGINDYKNEEQLIILNKEKTNYDSTFFNNTKESVIDFEKEIISGVKADFLEKILSTSLVTNGSVARGDDYPAYLKNAAPDTIIDPWRLYNRECTSFTAYRLSSVNKFELPGAYGNGGQWGSRAKQEGYRVDMNPAKGSVAWLDDGGYGHVAWVSNVIGNNVEIEEYNYNWNYSYNRRTVAKTVFTGYIHFKDLSGGTNSTGGSASLPASGTYYFTSRMGIKAEPKISSADLAYYDNGDSVHYDKTLEADNYQWISYIATSGNRRYIAINKLASSVTPVVKGTINIQNKNDQAGTFDVIITDVSSNSGLKEVLIPIWSTQNGQDDLVWYKATKQSNNYKVSVNISSHKNNRGEYNIHLYYIIDNGAQVGVGGTKITISEIQTPVTKLTGDISIKNKNLQTGDFDIVISNVSSSNGIKEVKVPVWATKNGQDDIIWYLASKQNDGTYKVTVKINEHKNYQGEYNIHLYYVQNNGAIVGVAATKTNIQIIARPSIPDNGTYTFTGHASIKAEPKMSSPELAYYDAGDSVFYDKVLFSDGHYWISYVGYSGNRRYISIT